MKHSKTLLTLGILGALAAYSMYLGYVELAYLSIGALIGYLGKVNGSGSSSDGSSPG